MKLRHFLPFVSLLCLAACSKRPVLPKLDTLCIDTLLTRNGNSCQVGYRFATIRNASDSPALETIEQANIGYFFQLEAFSGTAEKGAEAALNEILTNYLPEGSGPGGAEYEISAESEISVVDSLLCCVITRAGYTGGAHGMYGTECHTYSLTDGFELSLADLLTAGEMERLGGLIRREIERQYDAPTDEALTRAGFFPEYILPTENFRITPDGFVFCYNPYEIGCYALGSVEVAISRAMLDDEEDPGNE